MVIPTGTAAKAGGGIGRSHQEQGEAAEESNGADGVHAHAAHHPRLCAEAC